MGDPGRGTPDAPGSLPSKVGDGLQFVSALLAPANSSARLCQASAPTNPVPLPDANCFEPARLGFEKTVRLSHWQGAVQQPLAMPPHLQRLP